MKKTKVKLLENTAEEIQMEDFSQKSNTKEKENKINSKNNFELMKEDIKQIEENDFNEINPNLKINFNNSIGQNSINNQFPNNLPDNTSYNQRGIYKRATKFLIEAFSFTEEKEEEDINLSNEEQKKFLIKHIQSFQRICVEEELKSDDDYNFYFLQFFEIFILHFGFFIFGIFIVPFYNFIYGPQLIRNLGFWGKRLIGSRNAQYSYWIFFMITILFTYRIQLGNIQGDDNNIPNDEFFMQHITLTLSYMSILIVILRYMIVSIKYGFFPEKYYNDIKNKRLYKSNIKSNFLKFGWIEPDFYIINIYLKAAFKSDNTHYKSFFLECAGEIKESMISKITEIENEIQKGNNKKKESYKRKLKKEKKSTLKSKRTSKNTSNLKKTVLNETKSNSPNIDVNLKIDQNSVEKNTIKSKTIKFKLGSNTSLNIISNNSIILNCEEKNNKKMSDLSLKSLNEENSNYELSDDARREKNFNNETFDNISKASCNSSESSDGESIFSESNDNIQYEENNNNLSLENLNKDLNKNENLNDNIKINKGKSSLNPALLKLKNFVQTTLRGHIKKLKKIEQRKKESMQGKIEYLDKNVYKINGFYLSKMIMKKINNSINFRDYKFFHMFLVIMLLIIPNIFIYKIYLLSTPEKTCNFITDGTQPFSMNGSTPISNLNKTLLNNNNYIVTNNSSTNQSNSETSGFYDFNKNICVFNNTNKNDTSISSKTDFIKDLKYIKFNNTSFLLMFFSLISGIIPVWCNTENLIYGLIDFERRRKMMEILYDIINPKNQEIEYDLPILNITNQETMLNWYHLRNIMMKYGRRFTDRIMLQTSVFGVYLLISLVAMFIIFIGKFAGLSVMVREILIYFSLYSFKFSLKIFLFE